MPRLNLTSRPAGSGILPTTGICGLAPAVCSARSLAWPTACADREYGEYGPLAGPSGRGRSTVDIGAADRLGPHLPIGSCQRQDAALICSGSFGPAAAACWSIHAPPTCQTPKALAGFLHFTPFFA